MCFIRQIGMAHLFGIFRYFQESFIDIQTEFTKQQSRKSIYIFNDLHIFETVFGKVMEHAFLLHLMIHSLNKFYLFECNFFNLL